MYVVQIIIDWRHPKFSEFKYTSHMHTPHHSIMFGIAIGLTAVALIIERKEGLIDRTWVAGVNVTEIIIAQVVTQLFILVVQIILVVVVIIYAFEVSEGLLSVLE